MQNTDDFKKINRELKIKEYLLEHTKRAYEYNKQSLLYLEKEINRAQSTKAWKIMCLIRRINEQVLRGNKSDKKKFYRWAINKLLKKPILKELELAQFNPINNSKFKVLDLEINELEAASALNLEHEVQTDINLEYFKYNISYEFDVFRFPVIEWDFRWQRPQQISVQFAENGHRVFYFSIDTSEIEDENASYEQVVQQVLIKNLQPNIWWIRLCSNHRLNAYRNVIQDSTDVKYLIWSINYVKEKFNISQTISILDLPFWGPLATDIENNILIYDCMDDHEGFSTNSIEMLSNEEALMKSADLIITTSQKLYEKVVQKNPDTILVRNAGEYNHFSEYPKKLAAEYNDISGPVIGYYGAISEWFDIELIEYLAKKNKKWTFILIGDTFGCDISNASKLENIIFTGEKPYSQLPEYLHGFDVSIIPFIVSNLTLSTNPVKVYEYLAAGKPVVSVRLPELEMIDHVVNLASNYEEFESAIKKALNLTEEQHNTQKRKEFASSNTWNSRYLQIKHDIVERFFPKVSIVIVTFNNWSYTKQCLDSLLGTNDYPNTEIIIVDNASTDETRLQLSRIQDPRLKLIFSPINTGFAGGNIIGCQNSTSDVIILLNNDTIVPAGWIQKLIKPLQEHEDIGMVGPVSNSVGNDQNLDFFIGDSLKGPDPNWLKDFYEQYKGRIRYTDFLGFYCVAIKREVYAKIGELDINYGIGMFEDDDYCERVKKVGYKLAIVEDAFVYHHGSASFRKLDDVKYRAIFETNKAYFQKKWNKIWEFPPPPASMFYGSLDVKTISERVSECKKRIILVLGDINWNTCHTRMENIILQLANDSQNLVITYVHKYNGQEINGIRKFGPSIYFCDQLELLSSVHFDAILYSGSDRVTDLNSDNYIIDVPSYKNNKKKQPHLEVYKEFEEEEISKIKFVFG